MKKEYFGKRIQDEKAEVKLDKPVAMTKSNMLSRCFEVVGKKLLTAGLALAMFFTGLALAGCNDKKKTEQENPPFVDPEKPGPEKPDPTDPNPEKPGPSKPDPEKPDPEKPNPPKPDGPVKTPEELQKEKEDKIVKNIYTGIESKLRRKIGSSTTLNRIMAIDYEKSDNGSKYVYTLVEITTTNQHLIELYRIPMETEVTEENILSGNIKPNQYTPSTMFTTSVESLQNINTDTANSIYNKVKSENLIESKTTPVAIAYGTAGGSSNSTLGGYSNVHLYTFSNKEIEKNIISVKSDVYENNAILDNLINGTINKTFQQIEVDGVHFYHQFSDNVIINYQGLDYEEKQEANITLDVRSIGTYQNGRVYINLEEENV